MFLLIKYSVISILIFSLTACTEKRDFPKKESPQELRISKTLPEVYHLKSDSGFRVSRDTVYYLNQLYSGYLIMLNREVDTIQSAGYFNGVEEGIQRKWYDDGQPEETRFYINGKKEGLHQGWWPNGKKRFEFTAYNGEFEGPFREWTIDGILIKHFNYHEGYESGSQRLWWSDGKVRANYVIKNGKKYGLLGYKICVNPYDSIKTK